MIKMDNEKLQNLWFSPNIMSNQNKTNKMGGARRMHGGGAENLYNILAGKSD